jgi:putative ABC transport system permease protein
MQDRSKQQPPKWADRFLAWYCRKDLLEQIQGDVHELYYWRLEEKGHASASKAFAWDVLRLFRWSNIKRKSKRQKLNNMGMFKNYFKIGMRNLWKQRMPSTINILGLAIALACSIVAFKWIELDYYKDYVHENLDDLYLVTHWEELETNTGRNGLTDNQLIDEILASVPGIAQHSKYYFYRAGTKVAGRESSTFSLFVDEDYLKMFTFQLVAGSMDALSQADQVVINEDANGRFFGQELGIGKTIDLKIGDEWKEFTVGAILKNRQERSSMQNYLLVNYQHIDRLRQEAVANVSTNFFIQRQPGVEEAQLLSAMDELLPIHNKDNEVNPYRNFELESLKTMARNAYQIGSGSVGSAPSAEANLILAAISLFMVVLAIFNYINISLAMIMKRMKEIGVRKVIGSKKSQLVVQFLIENFLLTSFALLLGVLLSSSLLLPAFNKVVGGSLTIDLLHHPRLWMFLGAILIFITLASGIYPAIVASSYKPTSIFRNKGSNTRSRTVSSVFLTFQMILATITIVAAVMFVLTNRSNRNLDWGYNQYNKIRVSLPDASFRESFRAALESNPNVVDLASTKSQIGTSLNGWQFKNGEVKKYAEFFDVGLKYPDLLGVELVAGRLFDPSLQGDIKNSLVVNESFLKALKIEFDPDGTTVVQDTTTYSIIGVVKDYYYWAPDQRIRGAALRAIPESECTSFYLDMVDGDIYAQREQILDELNKISPDKGFSVSVQVDLFNDYSSSPHALGRSILR